MIRTEGLCKIYSGSKNNQVRAVDNVSLTVTKGRFSVLTGPSGSGKSTLLAMLGALLRPSSGAVVFGGQDLQNCSDVELARVRRNIGFVFQNFSLIPRLPVWENVTYPLIPRGVRAAARHELARQLLQQMGMADKMESRPEQLSGGEQQRVSMARALACQPELLLADEPTSNLDRQSAAELIEMLRGIHSTGVTLVLATHNPELIALATDVFELNEGKVV